MITSTLYVHVNKYSPHLKAVISVRYSCAVHSCNTTLSLQNAITMSLYLNTRKSNTSPTPFGGSVFQSAADFVLLWRSKNYRHTSEQFAHSDVFMEHSTSSMPAAILEVSQLSSMPSWQLKTRCCISETCQKIVEQILVARKYSI